MFDYNRMTLESKIQDLISKLTAPTSPIGDWKHIKYTEYSSRGIETYSEQEMNEYYKKRMAVREEINRLETELSMLRTAE